MLKMDIVKFSVAFSQVFVSTFGVSIDVICHQKQSETITLGITLVGYEIDSCWSSAWSNNIAGRVEDIQHLLILLSF